MSRDVTLQINFAPPDFRHAVAVLPHQLKMWAGQVSEIVLTLDAVAPAGGRFAEGWDKYQTQMIGLLEEVTVHHSHARLSLVDASPASMSKVGRHFFGTDTLPLKDSRGGPLYSYFFGLDDATHDHVLHMDSDMLFGGGSQTWVQEALDLMNSRDDLLFTSPLAGPPSSDNALHDQPRARPVPDRAHAHTFDDMSTRVFLLDRSRLAQRVGRLKLRPPLLLRSRLKARARGNPSVAMPEQLLSSALLDRGLARMDFLGDSPGMWSLHPPFRSAAFYQALPQLIAAIEGGEIPDEQRGHFDFVDGFFDFSAVRKQLRRSPLRR